MRLYLILLLLVILTGCRSLEVPPEAQNLTGLNSDNQSTATKEASILIRKKAFEKYNADTVVLVSSDAIDGIVGVKKRK